MSHLFCPEGDVLPGRSSAFQGECRWLISLDYDGTLREKHGPPVVPEFFHLMEEWRHEGVRWGINTGRSLPFLLEDLLPCSPYLPDFVCTCERYVYLADESRRVSPLRAVNDKCEADNLSLRHAIMPHIQTGFDAIHQAFPKLNWEQDADDPLSVEAQNAATMEILAPHFYALIAGMRGINLERAGRYMRYCDARYSKGTALHHVAHAWNVPEENIFIIGDGHNDLGAFKLFPRSFCAAPSGVHPEIAQYLHAQGGYVSSTGVLEALRYWKQKKAASI